ncbi:AbiJ-NTD4 domain-containing protein [Patescibacteria group bacterium]
MTYFSRRNEHIVEFSGYEEVSRALRKRLLAILHKYVGQNSVASFGDDSLWNVEIDDFLHEVGKEFPDENPFTLVKRGQFYHVFTIVEIFLDMVEDKNIYYTRKREAPLEILQAFNLSGSVYTINNRKIELVVNEDLAKKIENTKAVLLANPSAYEKFFDTISNFVGRKAKPEDVVKDVFVAFEDYLKQRTDTKDYGRAITKLSKENVISSTQKALMEKIYAYRSDTYGVGHAGNSEKPKEVDALWFIETVIPQLLFIDRKLK